MKILITFTILLLLTDCSSFSRNYKKDLQIDHTNKSNSKFAEDQPTILLISIDGYRFDYTKLYNPKYLKQFMSNGTYSKGLVPIYPSKTFPNHYSIATGMYAEHHGMISNGFYNSKTSNFFSLSNRQSVINGSWYKGTPLWVLAEQQQMLSASYFFVGTDANIQGIHPHYYYNYNQLTPHMPRITQIVDWLKLKSEFRPHFLTLYFSDVDTAGHRYGPNSEEVKEAVLKVDQSLGQLFEMLKSVKVKNLNIIIVSDHGMETLVDNSKFSYLSDYINLKQVIVTSSGSHLNLYTKDKKDIHKIYSQLKKMKEARIYLKSNIPKSYHYSNNVNIGDIIISAKNKNYILKKRTAKELLKNRFRKGSHGYEPKYSPNMKGIFYAKGTNIKKLGEIKAFENIHIYPFIAKILGLKINHSIDGKLKVLNPLLK